MRLIWPKKPVSDELMRVLKLGSESKTGYIRHEAYGLWFKYKGTNIVYMPFGNGHCIRIDDAESLHIITDFMCCTSLCALIRLVCSLRKGGDV